MPGTDGGIWAATSPSMIFENERFSRVAQRGRVGIAR